ncbi:MAG: hypothetical protein ACI4R8_04605 [Candidatus Caccovivens sp.]
MITVRCLENDKLFELCRNYRDHFKEDPFFFEMPTGITHLPDDLTEEKLIASLERCLSENIKLNEIYPSLNSNTRYQKGVKY